MAASSSSSSYSRNWLYDVFPSFRGEDVRVAFLSHFLKELDRKLISAFNDSEIERSRSLDPELKNAIRDSRIAVVVFSRNYASSSWCLDELLEIVNCKKEFGQMVIPVFYRVDPSNVRKQTGDFGKIFEETCLKSTEKVKIRWKEALMNVANLLGYHSVTWGNEATMIEAIANDVLSKLLLTPSKDFENFVGIEDHISQMSELLDLESEEVKMIGIWGSSGIGKTTIARVLFSRLSRHYQGSIYIDRRFIAKSMEIYSKSNPDDYNMKLHLQENFLCKILDKQMVEVDHLGAVKEKLKKMKVVIFIDDLDDQVVLDTLVGGDEWFGPRSRIIVVTKDKQILRSHGIKCVYEVGLPCKELALQMFCQNAFRQNSPPDGFMKLACEVAARAGRLPLGLNLLGSSMRGRNKKYWVGVLPTLRKGLDGKIEKALRVSYDGLEREEHKALFRHIACFFNGDEIDNIKLILADSGLNVDIGLEYLIDRSLIRVLPSSDTHVVKMHSLVEEMGKEVVRAQSDEPGEREFLTDSKNVCDVLEDGTGTKKIIGMSLDLDEIDELQIHKKAFKGMRNLRFLNIYTKKAFKGMRNLRFLNIYTKKWDKKKEVRWHLHEGFNYLPPKLRLLRWDQYPVRRMPSSFCPQNLFKLQMSGSKLEKLWEGIHSLPGLKNMDLSRSTNLKEIPDLSMATNLKTLNLAGCSSLVELPSSIQNLNKLKELDMTLCENLEILPTGVNLQSLERLLLLGCSRLKSFPDISSNIYVLILSDTAIEEFPPNLRLENVVNLHMWRLKSEKLWERVQPLTFHYCGALTEVSLNDSPNGVAMAKATDNHHSKLPILDEASPSLRNDNIKLDFTNCFNLNQEALIEKQTVLQEQLSFPGEEVPSYFAYQTSETYPAEEGTYSSLTILLFPSLLLQSFFRFRVCVVVICGPISGFGFNAVDIDVNCRFKGRFGNIFESFGQRRWFETTKKDSHMFIFDFRVRLNKDNALPQAELNYDHVDIQLHIRRSDHLASLFPDDEESTIRLKRWGVRLLNDYSSAENRLGIPNALPHVCEADEDNMVNDECHQTEQGEECGDNSVETERCRKRMRTT